MTKHELNAIENIIFTHPDAPNSYRRVALIISLRELYGLEVTEEEHKKLEEEMLEQQKIIRESEFLWIHKKAKNPDHFLQETGKNAYEVIGKSISD